MKHTVVLDLYAKRPDGYIGPLFLIKNNKYETVDTFYRRDEAQANAEHRDQLCVTNQEDTS